MSDEWEIDDEESSFEDIIEEEKNIDEQYKAQLAENIFNRLKYYCNFHGLNFLSDTYESSILDLINLL